MKGERWRRGSLLERMALRWKGPRPRRDESLDIFGELRRAQRILLIPNDRVGGLFMGAPIYKAVRAHYADAHIALLAKSADARLAESIPSVDEVLTAPLLDQIWSAAYHDFVDELRRDPYDLAICLGPDCSFRLAQLCGLSGARLRVGFQRDVETSFNLQIVRQGEEVFEVEQVLSLVRLLGIEPCGGDVSWAIGEGEGTQLREHSLDGEFGTGHVVAIDLGRGEGPGLNGRQVDDIVGRVIERGARAVLFFSLAERKQVNYLTKTYGSRVLPFEEDDLAGVAALLQGCRVLIACNTNVLHLALSLGVPAVGLFDEDARRWVSSRNQLVEIIEERDLRAISIARVVDGLERSLRSDSKKNAPWSMVRDRPDPQPDRSSP
jgi:ADP-heptose:LPS heptosyltransferase